MPDEKRKYDAEMYGVPALRLQPRQGRVDQLGSERAMLSHLENDPLTRTGFTFSREVILRLIDWLKDG
jgi:hypothetical protein